jgi:exosome complex component RRP42
MRTITNEYMRERLSKGIRNSKRGAMSYRGITLTQGTLPNAEGSAEAIIGNTKVLAGIKIDVAEPMPDTPEEGNLTTSAELLPMASQDYDIGPPTPEGVEYARVVDRGIRHGSIIDMGKLFIEEGKVWSVFLDLYVLNYDGNLFDAGTLAAMAALATTKMPRYEDGKVIRDDKMKNLETGNTVTSCTFAKVLDSLIIDPDGAEEELMKARLTIANDANTVRAMQKGLGGSFSIKEADALIDAAFDKSKDLRNIVKKSIGD